MIVRPVIPFASFPFSGFNYEEGPKGPIPRPNFEAIDGQHIIAEILDSVFTGGKRSRHHKHALAFF
jgi:hypothetical protein